MRKYGERSYKLIALSEVEHVDLVDSIPFFGNTALNFDAFCSSLYN